MRERESGEGVICMRREGEDRRGGGRGGEGGSSEAGRRRKRGAGERAKTLKREGIKREGLFLSCLVPPESPLLYGEALLRTE